MCIYAILAVFVGGLMFLLLRATKQQARAEEGEKIAKDFIESVAKAKNTRDGIRDNSIQLHKIRRDK